MKIVIFSRLLCLFTYALLSASESQRRSCCIFCCVMKTALNFPVADWAPQPGMKRDPCQRLKVSLFKAPRGSWPVPSALQNCANPAGWKLSQLLSVYTSVSPFTSRCHLCDFSFPFCAKSLWGQDQ